LEDEEFKFNGWILDIDSRLTELEKLTSNVDSQEIPGLMQSLHGIEREVEFKYNTYATIATNGHKIIDSMDQASAAAVEMERKIEKLTEVWDLTVHRVKNIGVALTTAIRVLAHEKREEKVEAPVEVKPEILIEEPSEEPQEQPETGADSVVCPEVRRLFRMKNR